MVPVAPGELIDKITILDIKRERITDPAKLANVDREWEALTAVRDAAVPESAELARLGADLKAVNERLWEIEDAIRDCERAGDFGAAFVELARAVYVTNDRRAALKRAINELLGSPLVEEKSYAAY
ncbi:MAG: hypothetical protein H6907_16060 [Hyphomicrobiales bacterium]|nr:hypothetical protein [Hyphomicrobiales bacterium]